ncbi:hypothetical protein Pmani_020659 [Petrolisthes manimaculis]|uniref:Uncharacterized protein n=1 Tax=Petrolisthes manimaculis TaxID=1843537 RepID=A0AAE1U6C5_9EUCA|nr:hypothetical protein Pmani_020659 [Petrolisthes manimaculis]
MQEKINTLNTAAAHGEVRQVRRLTKENPRLAAGRGKMGGLPLHEAATAPGEKGTATAKHLLTICPQALHVQDQHGRTPLHYSGMKGMKDTYKMLIKEGASEAIQDSSGYTPQDYQGSNGDHQGDHPEGLQGDHLGGPSRGPSRRGSHEDHGDVDRAIAAAEDHEDFGPLSDLLVRGDGTLLLNKTSRNPEVNSFLEDVPKHLESIEEVHRAVAAGDGRAAMNMLDNRKKAMARDNNHSNLVHKALLHGHDELAIQLARRYPELLQQTDQEGRTPLHYAAICINTYDNTSSVFHDLQDLGAQKLATDTFGHTPEDYIHNPDLMTEFDLKKELSEGLGGTVERGRGGGGGGGGGSGGGGGGGDVGGESRGRPFTKESEGKYHK